MERFPCQSRCLAQKATLGLLVHRAFRGETAETANRGQLALQAHKVPLVRKAPRGFPAKTACLAQRETSAHRAFLALQDETVETANKDLLVHKAPKARKATQEAACPLLTSCLCT